MSKNNHEKLIMYRDRVLSMKLLRGFSDSTDFGIMDLVIDDLEGFIINLLEEDEEYIEFMFSRGDNVIEKGVLPKSTNLEGYNWRDVFHESRMRNRKNNHV